MKRLKTNTSFILFLLLAVQVSKAQTATKATSLFKKGISLIDTDQQYEKGIKLLDSALLYSPSKSIEIQINFAKGVALNSQGKLSLAALSLQKNIPLINTFGPGLKNKFHANNYRVLGDIYKSKGEPVKSMEFYQKALRYAEKHNKASKAIVLHQIAVLLLEKEEYTEAERYLNLATDQYLNESLRLGKYLNLGEVYVKTNRYIEAEKQYAAAKELAIKTNNNNALSYVYLGLATIHFEEKEYIQAIRFYEQANTLSEQLGTKQTEVSSLLNLALSYAKTGQHFKALPYLKDAETMLGESSSKMLQMHLNAIFASVYENMGSYEKSIVHLKKEAQLKDSIFSADKNKQFEELKIAYESEKQQQEIEFLTLQKKKNELELFRQEEALKNLTLEKELEGARQENTILQLQQNTTKSENKIALLKKSQEVTKAEAEQSKLIKNAYLIGFFVLLIPLSGLLFVYYQKLHAERELSKKQKELNQQQITELVKDQQLNTIKASIKGQELERERIAQELHDFIGGNLAAIKLQLENFKLDTPKLQTVLTHLDETYEQVRHLSHDLLSKKIKENLFTDLADDYLKSLSASSDLNINFIPFNEHLINQSDIKIQTTLYKILQELINNTIKHANATVIDVNVSASSNFINLLFEDNGGGFEKENSLKGVGLINIEKRVKKINGTLNIDTVLGRGTLIDITIPYKYEL